MERKNGLYKKNYGCKQYLSCHCFRLRAGTPLTAGPLTVLKTDIRGKCFNLRSDMHLNFSRPISPLILLVFSTFLCTVSLDAQTLADDFEGTNSVLTWVGDNCNINPAKSNPVQQGINTSATVLEYGDTGGQYANIRFQLNNNFDLSVNNIFSVKIYVPSSGVTGNQPNQISLKLQDGTQTNPWETQTEIIKPIVLNQWQTITFDFQNDNYINLDPGSLPPTIRTDFNRLLFQINGENNNDQVLAYLDDFLYSGNNPGGNDPIYDYLVWSDEFDTDGPINNLNWHHQTQIPQGGSWYNGEVQHYTNRTDNSFVSNGILNIVGKKETYTNQGYTKQYTSARLNSKFAFTYGKVEVRAQLPTGIGTWPAIWMLGKNINEDGGYWDLQGFGSTGWPACGEIDIMEHWGDNQNFVQSATHTPSSFGNTINHGGQYIPTASNAFHVYTMEWYPDKLVFSVDGIPHYTYQPNVYNANTWPFNAEQYILLNFAIQPFISSTFNQDAMKIDYVRVFQTDPNPSTCVPFLNLTNNESTDTKTEQAIDYISSNSSISGTANITYHAGDYIDLTPGFEVTPSAIFHAYILECAP